MQAIPKSRLLLVVSLILLFASLSFNAYACLIPLFGTTATSMGNGCPTSDEAPARQFCDAFKMSAINSHSDSYLDLDHHTFSADASASMSQWLNNDAANQLIYDHPEHAPPRDVLRETTVLRI